MHRRPVISVAITSIGYDPVSRRLEIELHDGRVLEYSCVSEVVYDALLEAESRIEFVHNKLDGRFPMREIASR